MEVSRCPECDAVIAWIRPTHAVRSLRNWQGGLERGLTHGECRGDPRCDLDVDIVVFCVVTTHSSFPMVVFFFHKPYLRCRDTWRGYCQGGILKELSMSVRTRAKMLRLCRPVQQR